MIKFRTILAVLVLGSGVLHGHTVDKVAENGTLNHLNDIIRYGSVVTDGGDWIPDDSEVLVSNTRHLTPQIKLACSLDSLTDTKPDPACSDAIAKLSLVVDTNTNTFDKIISFRSAITGIDENAYNIAKVTNRDILESRSHNYSKWVFIALLGVLMLSFLPWKKGAKLLSD